MIDRAAEQRSMTQQHIHMPTNTPAFLSEVRAICLNLVEQGRQSGLQLKNLNVAALSSLVLSPSFS